MRNRICFLLAFLLVFSGMIFFAQVAEANALVSVSSLERGDTVYLLQASGPNGAYLGRAMVLTAGTTPYLVMMGNHFGTSAYNTGFYDQHGNNWQSTDNGDWIQLRTAATSWLNSNNPGYMTVNTNVSVPSKDDFETLNPVQLSIIGESEHQYWTRTKWPGSPTNLNAYFVAQGPPVGAYAIQYQYMATSHFEVRPAFHLEADTHVIAKTRGSGNTATDYDVMVPAALSFSSLTANGASHATTTTELTLTFSADPTTLTADNITVTGATKGALTGTGTTRTLAISNITVANGANVNVAISNPTGFAFTPTSRTVAVWRAPVPVANFANTTKTHNSATFTWTAATGATSVKIQQKIGAGAWTDSSHVTLNAASTTGTVTGLAAVTAYQFRLVVVDGGHAGNSNVVAVTTNAIVINIAAIPGITAPVTGATPVTTITATDQYTGTVTWNPTHDPFTGEVIYSATISLTPKVGFTLTGVTQNFFTVTGATATNVSDSGVVTAVFLNTAPAVIDIAAIPGVTAPVTGATPVTTITETAQYTGTVTWSPAHNPFTGEKDYTATITLSPKLGFTLTGATANFFTVAEATTTTNAMNSGVVTASFPATATVIDIAAIQGVTAPVTGETPVATITETEQYTGTVTWSPAHSTFHGALVYEATITLTPKADYTLTGVTENFFTVAGTSTAATNNTNKGVVAAVFPATDIRPPAPSAPEVDTKAATTIKLITIPGQEYSIDGGATWQDGGEFTGLSPGQSYTIITRVKQTETHQASEYSVVLNVTMADYSAANLWTATKVASGVLEPEQGYLMNWQKAWHKEQYSGYGGYYPSLTELLIAYNIVTRDYLNGLTEGQVKSVAYENGFAYYVTELKSLTGQIWPVQVEAERGQTGSLTQNFEAAYGPWANSSAYVGNSVEPDDAWWFVDADGEQTTDLSRIRGTRAGPDYVGNYFHIEQYAALQQGIIRRFISISSSWSHAFLEEDMFFRGQSEVRETFTLDNLKPGKIIERNWFEELF